MQLAQKTCCGKNNLAGSKCELWFCAMSGDFHIELSHISPRFFASLVGFYVTDISTPLQLGFFFFCSSVKRGKKKKSGAF